MMGYLPLTGLLIIAAAGWRAPSDGARLISGAALAMAAAMALQKWWGWS